MRRDVPELALPPGDGAQGPQKGSVIEQLDLRIQEHERHNQDSGLLSRGIALTYRSAEKLLTGSNSDQSSLEQLKKLREEALKVKDDQAALSRLNIDEAIKKDRQSFRLQDEVTHYGSSFVKAVPLFMTKGRGLYLSAALHGIDQVRTSTSVPLMAVDFTLGATKGALLKKGMDHFGASQAPMWRKGLALGGGMSFLDSALTSDTWYDQTSGKWHAGAGALQTAGGTLLGAGSGAVVFPIGHKISERIGATRSGGDALARSPLLRNLATGWSFGLASGTTGETIRQIQSGEGIDPLAIASRGALQSLVDMGAGGAGHKISFAGRKGESGRTNFSWSPKEATPQSSRASASSGAQSREFKIVGGEKALSQALTEVNGDGATIKVREHLGKASGIRRYLGMQKYGQAEEMFVQHHPEGRPLGKRAIKARLIAACGLRGSEAPLAEKAVLPGEEIHMKPGKDRLRFTTEAPPDGDAIKLGGTSQDGRQPLDGAIRNAQQLMGMRRIPPDAVSVKDTTVQVENGTLRSQVLKEGSGEEWQRYEWNRTDGTRVTLESVREAGTTDYFIDRETGVIHHEPMFLYQHGNTQLVLRYADFGFQGPRFDLAEGNSAVKLHVRVKDGADLREVQVKLLEALAHDGELRSHLSGWQTQYMVHSLIAGKASGNTFYIGDSVRAKGFVIHPKSEAELPALIDKLDIILSEGGLALDSPLAVGPTASHVGQSNRLSVTRDVLDRAASSHKRQPVAIVDGALHEAMKERYGVPETNRLPARTLREIEETVGLMPDSLRYDSSGNLLFKIGATGANDNYKKGVYVPDSAAGNHQKFGSYTDRLAYYELARHFGLDPVAIDPRMPADVNAPTFKVESASGERLKDINQQNLQLGVILAVEAFRESSGPTTSLTGAAAEFRQFAQQHQDLYRPLEQLFADHPHLMKVLHEAFDVVRVTDGTQLQSLERLQKLVEDRVARQRQAGDPYSYRSDEPNLVLALRNEIGTLRRQGGDVQAFLTNVARLARQNGDVRAEDIVAMFREASLPAEGVTLGGRDIDINVQTQRLPNEPEPSFQSRARDISNRWSEFQRLVAPENLPHDTLNYLAFRRQIFTWLGQNPDLWNAAIALGQHTRYSQIAAPIEVFFYHHQLGGSPVRTLDRFPDVPSDIDMPATPETSRPESPQRQEFDQRNTRKEPGSPARQVMDASRTAVTDKLIKLAASDRTGVEAVLAHIGNDVPEPVRLLNKHLLEHLLQNATSAGEINLVFEAINNASSRRQPQTALQPGTADMDAAAAETIQAARRAAPQDITAVAALIHQLIAARAQRQS